MSMTSKSGLRSTLEELYEKYRHHDEGKVADYIPELAKVGRSLFGLAAVTTGGEVFEIGDSQHLFTIQSAINPIMHGLALDERGPDLVESRIGVEPSGNPFNAINLNEQNNTPRNPMINAGAICLSDLVQGAEPGDRLKKVLDTVGDFVGREIEVDSAVYNSEKSSGHHNQAIASLLTKFKKLDHPLEQVLDLYFKQCSIRVCCTDLATLAATLANRGINPITGIQAVDPRYIRNVLSVMYTCGLYEVAGQWAYDVGLPAKSGVGGGLYAVVPGLVGIAIFSPPLNKSGASERGTLIVRDLARILDLHLMNVKYGEQDFEE